MALVTKTRPISAFPNGFAASSVRAEAEKAFSSNFVSVQRDGATRVNFLVDSSVSDAALDNFIATQTSGDVYPDRAHYFDNLPSSSKICGVTAWVVDGRKPGEGAGSGTGVLAYCDGPRGWKRVIDDQVVEK